MKSESWFKRADALLAACFIPVAIMILIFVQRQIFPFGDNSFLRTDMYHQYAPFFSEFQYKLKHGQSLLYRGHWHGGQFLSTLCLLPCEPTQLVDRALSKVFSYRVYDLYDCD